MRKTVLVVSDKTAQPISPLRVPSNVALTDGWASDAWCRINITGELR